MDPTQEKLQSQIISFLRFPLIVAVVFIHCNPGIVILNGQSIINGYEFPVYEEIRYFISDIVARIAVPTFFVISGFLFFRNTDGFNAATYVQKLKRRGKTLLIPYLFWNAVVILLFFLAQTFFNGLLSGNNLLISDYTWKNWLHAFWDGNVGENVPINLPLWFIRDLMVNVILTPVIYWGIKRTRILFVLIPGAIWFAYPWLEIPGINIASFVFFSFGSYFAIEKKNMISIYDKILPYSLWLYLALAICNLLFKKYEWHIYIHNAGILVGMALVVSLTAYFIKKGTWHVNSFLEKSSFFIYVYHSMPTTFIKRVMVKIIQPQTDISLFFLYLLIPTISITLGLVIYRILMKYVPDFTKIITGSR